MISTGRPEAAVDLTNCDREPIRIPGAIQSHGILLAVEESDLRVVQVSETVRQLGVEPSDILNRPLEALLGAENLEAIEAALSFERIEDANPLALMVTLDGARHSFDAILHRSEASLIVELEPAATDRAPTFTAFYNDVRRSIARLQRAKTTAELCDAGAEEVARLSGFDRVMIYRFSPDWHGEVIAERRIPELEPFLNLHYPASDIPRQARELYRTNWLRFIGDVNYVPSPIVPAMSPLTSAPLDLGHAVLRSVSPIHIEYLQNMRVGASMTISLIRNDELWGLVACHHRTEKRVSYQTRTACEFLGRTMSLQLATAEENESVGYRMRLAAVQQRLLESMAHNRPLGPSLMSAAPEMVALVDAGGLAIRADGELSLVGETPPPGDILAIIEWLQSRDDREIVATDELRSLNPRFAPLARSASGLLAFPLSRSQGNYLLWFRPEVAQTVRWGGDPAKPVDAQSGRISPRKSFETWTERVAGRSLPWQASEIGSVGGLRRVIGDIIIRRTDQLERMNVELARSNSELDSFAHIASHDLKEPLRGIHNYASYLVEDYGSVLDDDGRGKLETLVRLTQRMDELIESLLSLSRIGRVEFDSAPVDLVEVAREALELYGPGLTQRNVRVHIGELPQALCDRVRVREVFNNLVGNAMKYSDKAEKQIEIFSAPDVSPPRAAGETTLLIEEPVVTIAVRDDGIGIREKHLETVFQMFKRLHARDAYGGGTGAGLAIARRIVERQGGKMWATSTVGAGTTFYFTLRAVR